jgi:hypothetical protein
VDGIAAIAAGRFHSVAIRGKRPPQAIPLPEQANAPAAKPALERNGKAASEKSPSPAVAEKTQVPRPAVADRSVTTPDSKNTNPTLTAAPQPEQTQTIQPRPAVVTEADQPKTKDLGVKPAGPAKPEQAKAAQPMAAQAPKPSATDARKSEPNRPGDLAAKQTTKTGASPSGPVNPAAKQSIPPGLNDLTQQGLSDSLYLEASGSAVPVYHFTSVTPPGSAAGPKQHFCTIDEKEKYRLIDTQSKVWKYEGIAFFAYPEGRQPPGARPVHRFWSESLKRYLFAIDDAQKQLLIDKFGNTWKYQGIAWYAPPAKTNTKK